MDGERGPLIALTDKDRAVLELLAQGLRDKDAARLLGIAPRSAFHRVERVMDKLGATTRFEAGLLYERMRQKAA